VDKPLVLTHRGRADHQFPENTIEACELALSQGATALEVDVRYCGSGELVVFHDLTLKRLLERRGWLKSTILDDLRKYPLTNQQNDKKIFVPTLKEFINHFKNTVPINLEAKVFTPVAGPFAKYIARAIKASRYREQFWVSSFNPLFLRTVKHCGWDIKTGYLFKSYDILRRMTEFLWHVDYWHPQIKLVNDQFIKIAKKFEKELFVWTVNEQEDLTRILQYDNLKGVITDIPHIISTFLNKN
jgi:glycerophosphoryl diester phosphodiesterase